MLLPLLLLFPVAAALLALAVRRRAVSIGVVAAYALLHPLLTCAVAWRRARWTEFLAVDELNRVFLVVLAVVFAAAGAGSVRLLRREAAAGRAHAYYAAALLLFVASMTGALLSTNLALLWVFLEASTLASALLIYHHRTRAALEATWKYLFICSLGISFAFLGILLLSASAAGGSALFFDELVAKASGYSRTYLLLAYVFLTVGFATKLGLAPVHNWLPDAHAEAPAPVSALLSGALLNTAFLALMRVYKVAAAAGIGRYASLLLFTMGFLSLFVSAVFILRTRQYKRMLAYSSIEHMGILAIGLAAGGPAIAAALLHLVGHSLGKASFFLTAGAVYERFEVKSVRKVHGLVHAAPATGWLWLGSFAAVCAFPPFITFFSELAIARQLLATRPYLAALFFLFLLFVLYAMARKLVAMAYGDPERPAERTPLTHVLPPLALLLASGALGLWVPEAVQGVLVRAAAWVGY